MEIALIIFFILIDIIRILDFLKPLLNRKYLLGGYKIKFISPIWQYITLLFAFLGAISFLVYYIIQKEFIGLIYFQLLFLIALSELSKSYIILCKMGVFLDGVFFSYDEKKEYQYVTQILIWRRRIYAINTKKKFSYVFLRKKYLNEILNN